MKSIEELVKKAKSIVGDDKRFYAGDPPWCFSDKALSVFRELARNEILDEVAAKSCAKCCKAMKVLRIVR